MCVCILGAPKGSQNELTWETDVYPVRLLGAIVLSLRVPKQQPSTDRNLEPMTCVQEFRPLLGLRSGGKLLNKVLSARFRDAKRSNRRAPSTREMREADSSHAFSSCKR